MTVAAGLERRPTARWRRRIIYLRDLLREFVGRDIKLRYRRSVLGIAWSLLNPLAQLLVYSVVFQAFLPLGIPNYPAFLFAGLLAWNWFRTSVHGASGAIVDNRELVLRPGFPVGILPAVVVTSCLVHFVLGLPVLLAVLIASGHWPSTAIFGLPLVLVIQFALSLGLAYLAATCHVFFRDTQHLLDLLLLLGFYLTPVFYHRGSIPPEYQLLYTLNPMAHLVDAYRHVLVLGEMPDPGELLVVGLVSVSLLALGYAVFRNASGRFVDEL
jgi:lipopolysaccharide transport system permease protein